MVTYELTVSVIEGSYPKVVGLRRRGRISTLLARINSWCRGTALDAVESNIDLMDFETVDIVMDVPCKKLRQELLQELAGITAVANVRLGLCLPVRRRLKDTAVTV